MRLWATHFLTHRTNNIAPVHGTMAHKRMAAERPGQTLQPTALVHEAYLRLFGDQQPAWRPVTCYPRPLRRLAF